MFLWLCVVIVLVSAENLENDEISQRLRDILGGSPESDDQEMEGHWYQIANFQVNQDQNECKHLIIKENITIFLDENCKETLTQSISQKNAFRLIKTSTGEFLAAIKKNKETQTDSLALYGSNVDPKQLQQQLPKSLGDLLLTPCDKIYRDCTRKVRNTKEKCENIKKSFKKADPQAQSDYTDDNFTICTMNNTDYISYDDVFIPIEPSIKDSDKENQQTLISNETETDNNPERSPQELVKELAGDPSLSVNDKTLNHQNIKLDKDEDKDSAKAKMNDTSGHFEEITSNTSPQEYAKELADEPSLSENDETANHKNTSFNKVENKNNTNAKVNDTSERFENIASNELEVSNITSNSSVTVGARNFDLWGKGPQKSDYFISGVEGVTNNLQDLLNKVNNIVEKAKTLTNTARAKAYNANKNSIDSELNENIGPSRNPGAKVRENNTQRSKAVSRDYLLVTTPHSENNQKWIQPQAGIPLDSNDEGSGDYLLEDGSRNQATSTDSSLFEKYSKLYNTYRNSSTEDKVVIITTRVIEKQNLNYNKADENNKNKDDSSATKLPYDDFGEYLPTISHSDNNNNQHLLKTSESSDLENATPFEFDITNIPTTTIDASDSSSDDTITRNLNVLRTTNTTYNGTYSVTSMPTSQKPDVHHSSSTSLIINPTVVAIMMLIYFLNDG